MMDPGSHEYEDLQCPVCFEIPEDKIFLCQNGHTICGQCSASIKSCPQCRVSLATVKVRNRTLEALLDKLKFECSNKGLGCREQVGRKDIKRHLIDCVYSGKRIDFCKKIGFHQCDYSTNLKNLQHAIHHYRTAHEAYLHGGSGKNFPITLANFDKAAQLKRNGKFLNSKWSPVIIDLSPRTSGGASSSDTTGQTNSSVKLILLSSIHGKDRCASWMCVCLSPEPEATQLQVELSIKSLSAQAPDLSCQTPTIDPSHLDAVFHLAPFRVPVQLLLNHYVSKADGVGNLTMNLRVIRINGGPKQVGQMGDPVLIYNGEAERLQPPPQPQRPQPISFPTAPVTRPPIRRPPRENYARNGVVSGHVQVHAYNCMCFQCALNQGYY